MSKLKGFRPFLILALLNGLLLALHISHVLFKIPSSGLFFIENDHSLGEFLGYLQEFAIVILLGLAALSQKQLLYLAWALLFLYLGLDDTFQLHETLGLWLSQQFGFSNLFGLRTQDLGELIALALPYGLLILFVVISHFRADTVTKGISRALLPMLGLLIFFGVIVDMLHIKLAFNIYLERFAGFIEDGGEMVTLGLTLYTLAQWLKHNKAHFSGLSKPAFKPFTGSTSISHQHK